MLEGCPLTPRRIDFILTTFGDELRERASRDKLVAASGVQGGVSGFVQAVLVPELAISLVEEDLEANGHHADGAAAVIAESCEIGELLNPAAEDRVPTVVVVDD